MTLIEIGIVATASFGAAIAAFVCVLRFNTKSVPQAGLEKPDHIAFLFDGQVLQHATNSARDLLETRERDILWGDIVSSFSVRFPDFPKTPDAIREINLRLNSGINDDAASLIIEREGDMTRVELIEASTNDSVAHHKTKSLEQELIALRAATESAPYPMWQASAKGEVLWANAAYDDLKSKIQMDGSAKDEPLFPDITTSEHPPRQSRKSLTVEQDDRALWYDVITSASEDTTLFHAVDINAVIRAEVAQRNFVQTLAKTFAQLSTGLAVFDREGQLALFNPALVDLTSLPPEFLSARPDMLSFFDRLRDNRVMPEPKNYNSWRQEIADVIAAATDGRYQEMWALETGQTYRVTGRPHPDGASAFLFEDISAEIALTRNFRAELELSQSLLDTFDDALVVFSSSGVLNFSNAAYRELWDIEDDNTFADITIMESVNEWQLRSQPNPGLAEIRDFVMKIGDRKTWETEITMLNGDRVIAYLSPIVSGATLIRFRKAASIRSAGLNLVSAQL